MRLHKFVGTMGPQVPGMVGAHFHTAGSMAGDSGTPCLDVSGNIVGIKVGVYTDSDGEKRAVMINARQIFNFMAALRMIKGCKGGFVHGASPPPLVVEEGLWSLLKEHLNRYP